MEFEEKLTLPNLEVMNQRVATRCYLDSFSHEETSRYIVRQTDHLRIDPAHKASPSLFTEEAKRRIYQLTDGVPRLVNQLCGISLQFAADRAVHSIDGSLVNDAWLHLNHIQSDGVSEQTDASPVQECVISPEQIEEIIDRKKHTFQLRHFDSVEFGTLSDSEVVETVITDTYRSFHEHEYKPPYPEYDEEIAEQEETEPTVYPIRSEPAPSPGILAVVPKCPLLPTNFDQQRHKFRRRYLLQKVRHRLGLFASVLLKVESPQPVPSFNESDMNEQTLQEYGASVLEGRPPFVRQEPRYAYQTTESALNNDGTYPDSQPGVPIALRWLPENTEENRRFGVSYTEFLNRDTVTLPPSGNPEKNVISHTPNLSPRHAEPVSALVVRTSLNASQADSSMLPLHSGLEELFEESQQVGGSAVSLAELFRVDSRRMDESSEVQSLDSAAYRQLEAVIDRITKAAEKIEQAAEASGQAGRHISNAAEFVETEVRAVVPTYTGLFRQWSEFQEMITAELASARRPQPEPLQFRTSPRRQVMIERTVSTIDVESLLR